MKPFLALVLKDLKLFIGDRRAVIVTLAVPLAIGSFFGYVNGGESGQPETSGIAIQVVDDDQSEISKEIVGNLRNNPSLKVTISGEEAARQRVRNGKIALAVIIPKNFGEEAGQAFFGGGKKPVIGLPHDPSRNAEVGMVKGILMQHIMEAVSKQVFSGESGRKMVRQSLDQLDTTTTNSVSPELVGSLREMLKSVDQWMEKSSTSTNSGARVGGMTMPFATQEETESKPDTGMHFNGFAHSFGGMGIQFILMAAIELGIGILYERERGLWKRLRAAPLSRFTLLTSRLASAAVISFLTLLFLFGFSILVFHVRIGGSVVGFLLCCAAIAFFAASLGLFVGSIGKTPQATRGIAIFVVLVMVMLGGAWVPTFVFPAWVQTATLVVPTRWAVDGLAAMTWRGLSFSAVLLPVGVLLGYGLIFATLAVTRFRWETD